MVIEIPNNISNQISLSKEEILLELAIILYQKEVLSMRAAAELARMSWVKFEEILSDRKIYLQYSVEELEKDLINLKSL